MAQSHANENLDAGFESPGQPTDVETAGKLVNRIADLAGCEFSEPAARRAALALHYGLGTAAGCVYCFAGKVAFPRFQKEHSVLAGAAFGTALFLFPELVALPLMGLPNKGSQSPLGTWVYGITSHIVYGLTAAETCQVACKFL
ncbi:MAG: DUF1440 domain-containing protein [Candidatus Sulfotelmatobacter sp.]